MMTIIHNWKPSNRLIKLMDKSGHLVPSIVSADSAEKKAIEVIDYLVGKVGTRALIVAKRYCYENNAGLLDLRKDLSIPYHLSRLSHIRGCGKNTYADLKKAIG